MSLRVMAGDSSASPRAATRMPWRRSAGSMSPLPFLRSVGYAGLLIPLVSIAVALTLLPVLLFSWGDRLDRPRR